MLYFPLQNKCKILSFYGYKIQNIGLELKKIIYLPSKIELKILTLILNTLKTEKGKIGPNFKIALTNAIRFSACRNFNKKYI